MLKQPEDHEEISFAHRALLAHHRQCHLDRCYSLWIKGSRYYICARCLGLYPFLVLFMTIGFASGIDSGRTFALMGILAAPALVDWGLARTGIWQGTNLLRTVTGALLGAGLGQAMPRYFRNPFSVDFWMVAGLFLMAILLVEGASFFIVRRGTD